MHVADVAQVQVVVLVLRLVDRCVGHPVAARNRLVVGHGASVALGQCQLERLLDVISYEAADREGTELVIDAAYVEQALGELAADEDLSRYIL